MSAVISTSLTVTSPPNFHFPPQTALAHSSDLEDAGCLSVELVPVVIYH